MDRSVVEHSRQDDEFFRQRHFARDVPQSAEASFTRSSPSAAHRSLSAGRQPCTHQAPRYDTCPAAFRLRTDRYLSSLESDYRQMSRRWYDLAVARATVANGNRTQQQRVSSSSSSGRASTGKPDSGSLLPPRVSGASDDVTGSRTTSRNHRNVPVHVGGSITSNVEPNRRSGGQYFGGSGTAGVEISPDLEPPTRALRPPPRVAGANDDVTATQVTSQNHRDDATRARNVEKNGQRDGQRLGGDDPDSGALCNALLPPTVTGASDDVTGSRMTSRLQIDGALRVGGVDVCSTRSNVEKNGQRARQYFRGTATDKFESGSLGRALLPSRFSGAGCRPDDVSGSGTTSRNRRDVAVLAEDVDSCRRTSEVGETGRSEREWLAGGSGTAGVTISLPRRHRSVSRTRRRALSTEMTLTRTTTTVETTTTVVSSHRRHDDVATRRSLEADVGFRSDAVATDNDDASTLVADDLSTDGAPDVTMTSGEVDDADDEKKRADPLRTDEDTVGESDHLVYDVRTRVVQAAVDQQVRVCPPKTADIAVDSDGSTDAAESATVARVDSEFSTIRRRVSTNGVALQMEDLTLSSAVDGRVVSIQMTSAGSTSTSDETVVIPYQLQQQHDDDVVNRRCLATAVTSHSCYGDDAVATDNDTDSSTLVADDLSSSLSTDDVFDDVTQPDDVTMAPDRCAMVDSADGDVAATETRDDDDADVGRGVDDADAVKSARGDGLGGSASSAGDVRSASAQQLRELASPEKPAGEVDDVTGRPDDVTVTSRAAVGDVVATGDYDAAAEAGANPATGGVRCELESYEDSARDPASCAVSDDSRPPTERRVDDDADEKNGAESPRTADDEYERWPGELAGDRNVGDDDESDERVARLDSSRLAALHRSLPAAADDVTVDDVTVDDVTGVTSRAREDDVTTSSTAESADVAVRTATETERDVSVVGHRLTDADAGTRAESPTAGKRDTVGESGRSVSGVQFISAQQLQLEPVFAARQAAGVGDASDWWSAERTENAAEVVQVDSDATSVSAVQNVSTEVAGVTEHRPRSPAADDVSNMEVVVGEMMRRVVVSSAYSHNRPQQLSDVHLPDGDQLLEPVDNEVDDVTGRPDDVTVTSDRRDFDYAVTELNNADAANEIAACTAETEDGSWTAAGDVGSAVDDTDEDKRTESPTTVEVRGIGEFRRSASDVQATSTQQPRELVHLADTAACDEDSEIDSEAADTRLPTAVDATALSIEMKFDETVAITETIRPENAAEVADAVRVRNDKTFVSKLQTVSTGVTTAISEPQPTAAGGALSRQPADVVEDSSDRAVVSENAAELADVVHDSTSQLVSTGDAIETVEAVIEDNAPHMEQVVFSGELPQDIESLISVHSAEPQLLLHADVSDRQRLAPARIVVSDVTAVERHVTSFLVLQLGQADEVAGTTEATRYQLAPRADVRTTSSLVDDDVVAVELENNRPRDVTNDVGNPQRHSRGADVADHIGPRETGALQTTFVSTDGGSVAAATVDDVTPVPVGARHVTSLVVLELGHADDTSESLGVVRTRDEIEYQLSQPTVDVKIEATSSPVGGDRVSVDEARIVQLVGVSAAASDLAPPDVDLQLAASQHAGLRLGDDSLRPTTADFGPGENRPERAGFGADRWKEDAEARVVGDTAATAAASRGVGVAAAAETLFDAALVRDAFDAEEDLQVDPATSGISATSSSARASSERQVRELMHPPVSDDSVAVVKPSACDAARQLDETGVMEKERLESSVSRACSREKNEEQWESTVRQVSCSSEEGRDGTEVTERRELAVRRAALDADEEEGRRLVVHDYGELWSVFRDVPLWFDVLRADVVGRHNADPRLTRLLLRYPSLRPSTWVWTTPPRWPGAADEPPGSRPRTSRQPQAVTEFRSYTVVPVIEKCTLLTSTSPSVATAVLPAPV